MKRKKIILIENQNFNPQIIETEYEKFYKQRELIYILKTGEKYFKRSDRSYLTHFLLAGDVLHLLKREISRSKLINCKRVSTFNRKVVFITTRENLLNELPKLKQVFDEFLSYYKLEIIDDSNIPQSYRKRNNDENIMCVRLSYKRELVRWGLIEYKLLDNYREDVVKKTNGVVRLKSVYTTQIKHGCDV